MRTHGLDACDTRPAQADARPTAQAMAHGAASPGGARSHRPNQGGYASGPASRPTRPRHTRWGDHMPAQHGLPKPDQRLCKNVPAFTSNQLEIHQHYLNKSRISHLGPYTCSYSHFLTFTFFPTHSTEQRKQSVGPCGDGIVVGRRGEVRHGDDGTASSSVDPFMTPRQPRHD